ncbi:hypothetical protein A2U01_0000741 [Trifolium medium]|uniref:Uncharacterized protein n=1 Tax=Trifolium medium TaxID=97028 RepID=A0A392LYF3_9FABA|nr:hypothetical protein [Trifolium medium]
MEENGAGGGGGGGGGGRVRRKHSFSLYREWIEAG